MRRSFLAICLVADLAAAALSFSTTSARADRPHRGYGPVVVVGRPAPAYYRRYGGPPPGRYGSPYYGVTVNRIFGYPATYIPYGSRVAGGYAYPMGYSDAYGTFGPGAGDWDFYSNPLLQATLIENQLRWGTTLPPAYPEARTRHRVRPSTPDQQAKSVRAQTQGDVWIKRLRYLNAYERYKVAQSAASDRPEPYFRLGFSLAAVANYDSAVKYFKQGLDLDPQWPVHGERLDALFGEDNRLSVLSLIERVGNWVREDIRDPDRLFLMGVVLHFDGDTRSSEFFEAAYRLSGSGDHLLAFLHPSNGPAAPGFSGPANGGPAAPLPQEPQEVGPPAAAPPDFGPPGPPQGLFSPPEAMPGQQAPPQQRPIPQSRPRGMYQELPQNQFPQNRSPQLPPDQLPPDQLPQDQLSPNQFPQNQLPQNPRRQLAPPNVRPQNQPGAVIPQRIRPQAPRPVAPAQSPTPSAQPAAPRAAVPQNPKPAVRALPVPPLPAPEDSPSEPPSDAPSGPLLDGPVLAPPTGSANGGDTTAQSP